MRQARIWLLALGCLAFSAGGCIMGDGEAMTVKDDGARDYLEGEEAQGGRSVPEPVQSMEESPVDPETMGVIGSKICPGYIAGAGTGGAEPGELDDDSEYEPLKKTCIKDPIGNKTCFESNGDWFHVYDGASDGASAAAYWWIKGSDRPGRTCYNKNGYRTWDECNYNLNEKSTVCWHTCYRNLSANGPLCCYFEKEKCAKVGG